MTKTRRLILLLRDAIEKSKMIRARSEDLRKRKGNFAQQVRSPSNLEDCRKENTFCANLQIAMKPVSSLINFGE